jgi:hypothetical protein
MPSRMPHPGPWDDAMRRATAAVAAERPSGMDETCWDDVAMRGIVAMVLYALHLRESLPVDEIPWPEVLWQLRDDQRVEGLVAAVLPNAVHDLARTARPGDSTAECWRWLTRTWDPRAPVKSAFTMEMGLTHRLSHGWVPDTPEPRWGGMSRGIGNGLPDPALEVCTHWAADIVQRAIITERGGHHAHDRVKAVSGAFAGHRGTVRDVGWYVDDENERVDGPAGYVVQLDDREGVERFDANEVKRCSDRRPPRPRSRFMDSLLLGVNAPPELKTCEEDLAEKLDRASNPEIVPERLRRTIAAAHLHRHLELERQASPSPQRFTWCVLVHWYQLTERYADDKRADLYEVIITRHLHDPEPAHHLALSEDDAHAVIARYISAA